MVAEHLSHYGILGMKWGQHRGHDTVGPSTKRYERKVNSKNISPSNKEKYQALLKASKAHDKRLNDLVRSTSAGKLVAHSMLLGPIGATRYFSLKADHVSTGKAISKGIISTIGGSMSYGVSSLVQNRTYK